MAELDKVLREATVTTRSTTLAAAIKAVLDLHAPESHGMRTVCEHCIGSDEDPLDYPCPTVRRIASQLHVLTEVPGA